MKTEEPCYTFTGSPEVKSVLHITPCFAINCTHPMPCLLVRFWHRVLLGWRWENAR